MAKVMNCRLITVTKDLYVDLCRKCSDDNRFCCNICEDKSSIKKRLRPGDNGRQAEKEPTVVKRREIPRK